MRSLEKRGDAGRSTSGFRRGRLARRGGTMMSESKMTGAEAKPKRPVSEKQLAANRRNAQRSTGPRTERGRAVSRFNNLQHGLRAEIPVLPGESAEEFLDLVATWTEQSEAGDHIERCLAERAAIAEWKLRR